MRVSKRAAAIFAAIVSLSAAAFGQVPSGRDKATGPPQTKITGTNVPNQAGTSLSGTVVDIAGAVIPNAKITIIDLRTNEITKTVTNDEGRFKLDDLAEGIYSIKIESQGFQAYNVSDVVVERNISINMDVVLEVGTVGEIVIVEPTSVAKRQ
jgi:hypothetical protein